MKSCSKEMVYVPSLRFKRGSENGDEQPVREILVSGFCADRFEFANQELARVAALMATGWTVSTVACGTGVMKAVESGQNPNALGQKHAQEVDYRNICGLVIQPNGSTELPHSRPRFDSPKQPLVEATWNQADAICRAQGKRLPTEAEWERMARGREGKCEYGTKSCMSLKRSEAQYWGDPTPEATSDVDAFPSSDLGIYGLAGNVWEWVSDWYQKDYYKYAGDNSTGPGDNDPRRSSYKVLRGGSWDYYDGDLRASDRFNVDPGHGDDGIGFRCVSSPE